MSAHRPIFVLVLFSAVVLTTLIPSTNNPSQAKSFSASSADTPVQFTSHGHVLGFQSDGVIVSNATYALRVNFVGANSVAPRTVSAPQATHNTVPPLARVTYSNLWNGITLTYDAPERGILRWTYTLAPFASVESIRMRYNAPVKVNSDATLSVIYGTGQVSESAPIAWQELNGLRVPVDVAFVARGERQVSFVLGKYDAHVRLMIDPMLTWNTFLGSANDDTSTGMALDANGNLYVTGISNETWGSPVRSFTGFNQDAFVAKLDPAGALTWNTFLGGNGFDHGIGIAVDDSSNAYVAGISTDSWGVPIRAFTANGNDDAFAAKLDSAGVLKWNTFLGGLGVDHGAGIAVDGNGKPYVAGISTASWGNPVRAFSGINDDAFVVGLDASGALAWNTFLGGDGVDHNAGIAADGSGNAIVTGTSSAAWGIPIRAFTASGNDEAFAAKLGSNGVLTWNTFLGGNGADRGAGVVVDGTGNVYITGISGTSWGNPVRAFAGTNDDAFAVKLGSNGALTWNTFLGGFDPDRGAAIAVDGSGKVYVTGVSDGTWGDPVRAFSGALTDAFAAKLDSAGAFMGNTFLGSHLDDDGVGIAVHGSANVYVTGTSRNMWGNPILPFNGFGTDAFAAQIPDIISCAPKPEKPLLIKPGDTKKAKGPRVKLNWDDTTCATTYDVILRKDSKSGPRVSKQTFLRESQTKTKPLTIGVTYYWRVMAFNSFGRGKSVWHSFTVK